MSLFMGTCWVCISTVFFLVAWTCLSYCITCVYVSILRHDSWDGFGLDNRDSIPSRGVSNFFFFLPPLAAWAREPASLLKNPNRGWEGGYLENKGDPSVKLTIQLFILPRLSGCIIFLHAPYAISLHTGSCTTAFNSDWDGWDFNSL
jgi:hypothetical protein